MSIFGRTKEFSEVRRTSLMCNFGVHSRFLDVIHGVRPPNGSLALSRVKHSTTEPLCSSILFNRIKVEWFIIHGNSHGKNFQIKL